MELNKKFKRYKHIDFDFPKEGATTGDLYIEWIKNHSPKQAATICFDRGQSLGAIKAKLNEAETEMINKIFLDFISMGAWAHWNGFVKFNNSNKPEREDQIERKGYIN